MFETALLRSVTHREVVTPETTLHAPGLLQADPTDAAHASSTELVVDFGGKTYILGRKHPIKSNESFNAVQEWRYPSHLPGMARIMLKLRSSGCPINVLDEIMRILEAEFSAGNFNPLNLPRTKSSMKKIMKLFPAPPPSMVSVPVERTRTQIKKGIHTKSPAFPLFDFMDQVQDLLDAEEFGDAHNLCVNPKEPFSPFVCADVCKEECPSELQCGRWYQNLVQHHSVRPYEILLGLVFNVDKTGARGNVFQRHSAEPLMFTLSIFTEECRRKPHLWKCLGFLPMPIKSKKHSTIKIRHYHASLDCMLSKLIHYQKKPPLVRVRIGEEYRYLFARFCIVNFISDGLANETLTGRMQSRGTGCRRLCRACHTPTKLCSDVNQSCRFLCQHGMEKLTIAALGPPDDERNPDNDNENTRFHRFLSTKDKKDHGHYKRLLNARMLICQDVLKKVFSSHPVDNAFFKLDWGPNLRGIFGATPTDLMHAFEEGVVEYFLKVILDPLPEGEQSKLDEIATHFFAGNNNRGVGRLDYPRVSFSGRFTSLSLLSSDEKMGKLLLLYLVSKTERGSAVLQVRCDPSFDQKKQQRKARFQGCEDDESDESSSDEEEDQPSNGTTNRGDNGTANAGDNDSTPTSFSKVDYNDDIPEHRAFVDQELQNLDLEFLLDWLDKFDKEDILTVRQVVWDTRRASVKRKRRRQGQFKLVTKEGHLQLPNDSNGSWEGCCDRRQMTYTTRPPLTGPLSSTDGLYCNPSDGSSPTSSLPDEEASISVDCDVKGLISLMEIMLSFHAFYKYHPNPTSEPNFFVNVRKMMSMLKGSVNRGNGTMNWQISKFHELLHILEDSTNFGSPRNYDASKTEKGLQKWVKTPSATVAKRGGDKYQERIATRLSEIISLEKACAHLQISPRSPPVVDETTAATVKKANFKVCKSSTTSKPFSQRVRNRSGDKHVNQDHQLDAGLLKWLIEKDHIRFGSIVYSEVYLKDGSLLRASPDYGGTGPWYDWVTYLMADEDGATVECPFLVLGFFVNAQDVVTAFGKTADYTKPPKEHCTDDLLFQWKMLPDYEILDLDTVVRSRVFALQVPRISKTQNPGAEVGNMFPWPGHIPQVEKDHLLSEEVMVFSDRLYRENDEDLLDESVFEDCNCEEEEEKNDFDEDSSSEEGDSDSEPSREDLLDEHAESAGETSDEEDAPHGRGRCWPVSFVERDW